VFGEQFARSFPKVKLQIERTVTDDGQLLCSGGSTSGSDLLLHLVRKFSSPQLAAECAKKLLVDTSERSQTPYSSTTFKKNHTDADILKIQIWLENRIGQNILMEQVADDFGLGMRNFIRRFKEATEQTPIEYLQNLRLEKAKFLLESSQQAFDQITLQVGYEDGNSFRRLFKQRVGLTPSEYRKKFENVRG
jgi:transcriptional regulator GlxA family with amidase domain